MGKTFRAYDMSQLLLLPPDLRKWLREDHLALYVSDLVEQLDLCAILKAYEEGDARGRPPYHPQMMVKLLIYGYCVGKLSSRKMEQASYEDVGFRVLCANQQPDHASIAEFRKRHLRNWGACLCRCCSCASALGWSSWDTWPSMVRRSKPMPRSTRA